MAHSIVMTGAQLLLALDLLEFFLEGALNENRWGFSPSSAEEFVFRHFVSDRIAEAAEIVHETHAESLYPFLEQQQEVLGGTTFRDVTLVGEDPDERYDWEDELRRFLGFIAAGEVTRGDVDFRPVGMMGDEV